VHTLSELTRPQAHQGSDKEACTYIHKS